MDVSSFQERKRALEITYINHIAGSRALLKLKRSMLAMRAKEDALLFVGVEGRKVEVAKFYLIRDSSEAASAAKSEIVT